VNVSELARDSLALIQDIELSVESVLETGKNLWMMGTAVVKVVQKGHQAVTYLITRRKEERLTDQGGAVDVSAIPDDAPLVEKSDVALIVDINRRIVQDVARYLDGEGVDADLVILTNTPDYSDTTTFLDPEDAEAWTELVKEFNVGLTRIKRAVGSARLHIFLSTPLALAFGLGTVWGTVDNAVIYHWEDGTYHPAMEISRELRNSG
jgi:hypothetical protein